MMCLAASHCGTNRAASAGSIIKELFEILDEFGGSLAARHQGLGANQALRRRKRSIAKVPSKCFSTARLWIMEIDLNLFHCASDAA